MMLLTSTSPRVRRGLAPVAVLVGLVVATATAAPAVAQAPQAAAQALLATIHWNACPDYSDAVLRFLGWPTSNIPEFRRLWARIQCGTVQVPMDYSTPDGRQITIAVTRLRATDQAHRLGSLAVNPGGPGGSGYLLPVELVMDNTSAPLNDRYDLIGFDPRGVGYSTKVNCPELTIGGGAPAPGPITEQEALQAYRDQVKQNQECATHDPAFLTQLTTANVARDLNRIRIALHEQKISYFGRSWGTALGAAYRSQFPATVRRMWLDSVMGPDFRLDRYGDVNAQATAADGSRMAAWIARHDATYGFGSSATQVESALTRLRRAYDAHPRKFTDLDPTVDGANIAFLVGNGGRPNWPLFARALAQLRDATGPTAPPTVKQIFGQQGSQPPPGAPEGLNITMHQAVLCNEDSGRRDFESGWAQYQRQLAQYPLTGRSAPAILPCGGWPLPVKPWKLRATGGSLELSGHRYEIITPYVWTRQMQATIGGNVFTVNDDIHGSAGSVPACATHIVAYFDTGRPDTGQCPGVPEPSTTATPGQSSPAQTAFPASVPRVTG